MTQLSVLLCQSWGCQVLYQGLFAYHLVLRLGFCTLYCFLVARNENEKHMPNADNQMIVAYL